MLYLSLTEVRLLGLIDRETKPASLMTWNFSRIVKYLRSTFMKETINVSQGKVFVHYYPNVPCIFTTSYFCVWCHFWWNWASSYLPEGEKRVKTFSRVKLDLNEIVLWCISHHASFSTHLQLLPFSLIDWSCWLAWGVVRGKPRLNFIEPVL